MDKITNKIITGFALVLLAGLGIFGFFKVTSFLDLYSYNKNLETSISGAITATEGLDSQIAEAKTVFQETNDSKNSDIADVLPSDEDITSLTRAFDDFSVDNNFSNNPFFISSITYNDSTESDTGTYMMLPLSVKVESSEDNFYKFLEYIENSGNLDNRVRLMDITDVSTTFVEDEDSNTISFSLNINAYFQK